MKRMILRVRLFARAKDLAGAESIQLELTEPVTVGELRRRIAQQHAELRDLLLRSAIAVEEEFAEDGMVVRPEMTIAVIPPVSGG